jgi:hypothetical protein
MLNSLQQLSKAIQYIYLNNFIGHIIKHTIPQKGLDFDAPKNWLYSFCVSLTMQHQYSAPFRPKKYTLMDFMFIVISIPF